MPRTSRTQRPAGAPYRWQHHQEPDGERVVENEIDACLNEHCRTQLEYDACWGDIEATQERAAAGALTPPDEQPATPVRLFPELWELRWMFRARPLRMYHVEPAADPRLLLALKVHWKWIDGDARAVDRAQDDQMAEAAARFRRSRFHP